MSYKSRGIIHLIISGKKYQVLFTPDNDHAVKHDGKQHTVFFNGTTGITRDGDTVTISLNGKFRRDGYIATLTSISIARTNVEVEVKEDLQSQSTPPDLKLVGITVPAK